MARWIAVSFENDSIKVVYASLSRGSLTVQKTLLLNDENFDNFLKQEKTRHFVVVCDFKTFYQDILLLPPVKEKYLENIIQTEIRKKAPELKDFSFFYTIHNERVHEGRKMKETFVFAVSNDDLSQIIDRFSRYGKTIKYIYSNAFALSCLLQMSGSLPDEPLLCVAEPGTSKTFFF